MRSPLLASTGVSGASGSGLILVIAPAAEREPGGTRAAQGEPRPGRSEAKAVGPTPRPIGSKDSALANHERAVRADVPQRGGTTLRRRGDGRRVPLWRRGRGLGVAAGRGQQPVGGAVILSSKMDLLSCTHERETELSGL